MARKSNPRTYRRRIATLRKASELGNAEASLKLGWLLEEGLVDAVGRRVVAPDRTGAVAAFRRAAELGDLYGVMALGLCYDNGTGVRRNKPRALRCYLEVFYDREGKMLTVWFTDRSQEYVCEETGDEVVQMKDRDGHVIGFEKLNFSVPDSDSLRVALETAPA